MWKYISRGIRAPFERGTWSNRTTASTSSADQSGAGVVTKEKKLQVPCPFRFVPCFLQICQRHLSQLGLHHYEERSHGTGNGRRSSSHKSTGDSFQSDNINYQPCAIIGAVGWSGVLVLGWTILQQPWYRHRKRPKQLVESEINPDSIKRYTSLYRLLLNPVFSQPVNNHILPSHIQLNDKQLQSSSSTDSSSLNESETKVLSPEEAFDEAAEEVRKVHEKVIGECENKRGVACLSLSRNHEAIEHFKIASAFNNAPAAFNLGQCYELGIGTNQDFTQAAYWYEIASEMGHASATYNLGVFYAHGWGGLKADSRRARKLFLTAAALGQPEAQAALNLEHKTFIDNNKDIKSSEKISMSTPEETFESRLAFDFFKMNNISLRFTNKTHQTNISNNNLQEYKSNLVDYTRPDSSLPSSSSSPPSTPSSSQSSSSINTNEHPLMFKQHFSPIDESSETYSEASSEDEWQAAVDLASMNGNSTTLYRLAVCYENSPTVDPELILQLYRMAADHGHERAKQRLKVLEEHYSLGTLEDYLKSYKKRSKHSSVSSSDCKFHE